MRVTKVEEGNGYVKVGSVIKKLDWVLVVKVEQVKEGSGSRKVSVDLHILD